MILYYNKWRTGTYIQSLTRPKGVRVTAAPAEYAGLGMYEPWINMLMENFVGISRQQAVDVLAVLIWSCMARGISTKIGITVAMNDLVATYIKWSVAEAVIQWFVLASVVVLILAVVLPIEVKGVEQFNWGHGWTLKYQNRIWDADLLYWHWDGTPVFTQLTEWGAVVGGERRNVMRGGVFGDYWLHGLIWQDVEYSFPYWYAMQWWESYVGWVGMCDRVSGVFPGYKLQKQYLGNLP